MGAIWHNHGIQVEVALLANSWNGSNEQTVSVPGVVGDETLQTIQIAPKSTDMNKFLDAQILVVEQTQGHLKFRCTNVPSSNIDIYVVMFSVLDSAEDNSF